MSRQQYLDWLSENAGKKWSQSKKSEEWMRYKEKRGISSRKGRKSPPKKKSSSKGKTGGEASHSKKGKKSSHKGKKSSHKGKKKSSHKKSSDHERKYRKAG